MGTSEEFVLVLVAALVYQDNASLEMGQGDAFVPMGLGDHFVRGGLGSFPFVNFQAVLDHFLLAGEAVTCVLFIGFLEAVQGKIDPVLPNILEGFFICPLSLLVRGAFWLVLCQKWGNAKREQK